MSDRDHVPPAPKRQQGPPSRQRRASSTTRVATSDSRRSLRDARGSLPLTPGGGLPQRRSRDDAMIRVDGPSWQQGYDAGLLAHWSGRQTLAASIDRWSWVSGYIEGDAVRLTRGSRATRKLDANREY